MESTVGYPDTSHAVDGDTSLGTTLDTMFGCIACTKIEKSNGKSAYGTGSRSIRSKKE
jgi:hypothetical protein